MEADRAACGVLAEHAVEREDVEVEMRVERATKALGERDGADLSVSGGPGARAAERGTERPEEDGEHRGGHTRLVVEEGAEPLRKREDPLAHGQVRQEVVGQVRRDLGHAAGVAGKAGPSSLGAGRR